MRPEEVCRYGEELREHGVKLMTTIQLIEYLKKATGVNNKKTVRNYMEILYEYKFIRPTGLSTWEIITDKNEKKEDFQEYHETKKPFNQDNKQQSLLTDEEEQMFSNMMNARPVSYEEQDKKFREKIRHEQLDMKDYTRLNKQDAEVNRITEQVMETRREEYKNGFNICWVDQYEYYILCDKCYAEEPLNNIKGVIPNSEIMSMNITRCHWCGKDLKKDPEDDIDESWDILGTPI